MRSWSRRVTAAAVWSPPRSKQLDQHLPGLVVVRVQLERAAGGPHPDRRLVSRKAPGGLGADPGCGGLQPVSLGHDPFGRTRLRQQVAAVGASSAASR